MEHLDAYFMTHLLCRLRNEEDEQYQEHLKKMRNVAESRRNMRVDLRPSVVAKTMHRELLLFIFAVGAAGCLPLYFLKVRPAQLAFHEQVLAKEQEEVEKEQRREMKKRAEYARKHYKTDMSLTTEEKAMRMSGTQLK